MYRPKPHILISINSDGSGSIKQYDSYEAAKVAYDALSAGTLSAFIYSKPNKSLSTGAIGSPLAIPAKVEFTPVQNATAIYNPGNPAFTAPHPDVAQFIKQPDSPIATPPLPRVTEPNPFGNTDYNQWQAFCALNPGHPQCTTPGNPQFGTLVSSACEVSENYTDARGIVWPTVAPIKAKIYANGRGGEYKEYPHPLNSQEGGCFWPLYFATEGANIGLYYANIADPKTLIRLAVKTYDIGGGWMPILDMAIGDCWTTYGGQDGHGYQRDYVICGIPAIGENPNVLYDYAPGSYLRNVNADTLLNASVNGWSVSNPPANNEIHQGKWFVDFAEYTSSFSGGIVGQVLGYPRTVRLRFRYRPNSNPISPYETVPPPGMAGRAILNEYTGDFEGIDSSETVEPQVSYEYDYQNVTITEMGTEVPVGTKQKATMTNVVDGPFVSEWSEVTFYSAGTLLASDGTYDYKATGDGGYYADLISGPSCDSEGTFYGYGSRDEFIYPEIDNAPSLLVGVTNYSVYADGSCGSYESGHTTEYVPNGGYLGDGDTLKFYSNGTGGYYTEAKNPPEGTDLGTYTDTPIYDSNSGFAVGYQRQPNIADGNGGSTLGAGSFVYYEAGTVIGTTKTGSSDGYAYYSDGQGGSYSQYDPYTPPNPSYGTYLDSGSGDNTIDVGCGSWVVGSYTYNIYADGNGGTYTEGTGSSYVSYGVYLGSCNGYEYYSDNNGGYYTQGGPSCPSYGSYAYNQDNYNYYHDGMCGYYQGEYTGGPSCAESGTATGNSGSTHLTADAGCGPMQVGYYDWAEYNDGNCGVYTSNSSNYYSGYGTYIGECNGYYYYSDGNGGIYN